jgi:hypothetical protein
MADVYEHVTPAMRQRVLDTLQTRWEESLQDLTGEELGRLLPIVPPALAKTITHRDRPGNVMIAGSGGPPGDDLQYFSCFRHQQQENPAPCPGEGPVTCGNVGGRYWD